MHTAPAIFRELRPTLALAVPIIFGQVGQMLLGIADSVMIGRVGNAPLAASAFAHSLFVVVFIVCVGLLMAVSVLVARAHGAKQPRDCADYMRHGMAIAAGTSVVGALLLAALVPFLDKFGQPPEVIAEVVPYHLIMAASLVPALIFHVLRQFGESTGHPWAPMAILLGSVLLNIFLNWLLIYGNWGLPALGLTGAGWATLVSRVLSAAALYLWLSRNAETRSEWPAHALAGDDGRSVWLRPLSRERLREMFAIGIPAAGQLLFEVGAFASAAIMMGWLGTEALAAHQIALSCASFAFMFPLGLGLATSVRVGRAVGEGNNDAVRHIGFGSLVLGVAVMALFAVTFVLAGKLIASGFTPDAELAALAARLLIVAAIFQVFDGAQVIGAGALRGLADVKVPTAITFVAYWVVSLPAGYLLAFKTTLGPIGVWTGLAAGLSCAALLLGTRFNRLTRMQPAPAAELSRIT